jgi:hypothetical protein
MHSSSAPGTVAIAGRSAFRISASGFEDSSVRQNATSSAIAATTV